jgi:hypothetical protein
MQQFKTRLRLLAEKLGGTISYGYDGSLGIVLPSGRVNFMPSTRSNMHCEVIYQGEHSSFAAPKTHCFDIIYRIASPHLASKLMQYTPNPLVELEEYIDEERAGKWIEELKDSIANDPSIETKKLGGNHFEAEYYHGYLILTDDLCYGATNMVRLYPEDAE